MESSTAAPLVSPSQQPGEEHYDRLVAAIDRAAHRLPAQGPITVFIHHNTLHAFEDLPFHDAVRKAAQVFGCQPYLPKDRYRAELRRGRIRFGELQEVLENDLGARARDRIPCFGTVLDFRLAMLQFPLRTGPTEELVWYVAEEKALRRVRQEASSAVRGRLIAETRRWVMRDLRRGSETATGDRRSAVDPRGETSDSLSALLDRFGEATIENWTDEDWEGFTLQALWRVCCDGVRGLPVFTASPEPPVRHRDLLLQLTGADSDVSVNDLLIRFCASFLDQGFAHWALPGREAGFYHAFCKLYRFPGGVPEAWMNGLAQELGRLDDEQISPIASIFESLEILGVADSERDDFLSATFLALRGWAGMVHQLELRGDRVVHPVPHGTLHEFLAIRLVLERFAIRFHARESCGYGGPLCDFRAYARERIDAHWPPSVEQRAFMIFQLAQILGLSPDVLIQLCEPEWATILEEIERFSSLERRRIFHLAYERRFTAQALDAVAIHARKAGIRPTNPHFQMVCCLDEREESFRRHLEELYPDAETFGAAGFFNIAMYYRGTADAHAVALCPVVIRPQHWVTEEAADEAGETHRRRARTRKAIGTASHHFHTGSRTFALGALLSAAVGVLASIPLVARILMPRLTARIRQSFGRIVQAPPNTRLRLERSEETPGPESDHIGFSLQEMTDIGERLLRDTGLTTGFSRLLILLGHGSASLNNPHNSAYHCGACGGSGGGPNARALAQILNDPRVRQGLARRGLLVPDETVVVGGSHNTCNDSVTFLDQAKIPASHHVDFDVARSAIEAASDRNAHERCRRFMSAPLTLSFSEARNHVEERSEDLAQTRPELGHATNAITVVGRREWTRGLFLDRRAFLTSYDPTQDDSESTILTRILLAVFPVCSGINLEYYFSHVDNAGFGAGTKLPHNLTALLGVMDGAASDLRTGLPWQMVEIHEPVRSLFIIETTAAAMETIMGQNEGIGKLCRNGWVLLALIHPETRELSTFQDGEFRPYAPQAAFLPKAASSVDWYRGWRDHLEFAEIER